MTIRIFLAAAAALALAACGPDEAIPRDASTPPIDAAIDGPPITGAPCLERPTELPRPPTGALPCDLLPPGFAP